MPKDPSQSRRDTPSRKRVYSSGVPQPGYSYGYGSRPAYDADFEVGEDLAGIKIIGRSMQDILHWFLKYLWLTALTTVTGALLGLYYYSTIPKQYQSWAGIEIRRIDREAADIDEDERIRLSLSAEFRSAIERLKTPSLFEAMARNPALANRTDLRPAVRQWRLPWAGKGEESGGGNASPGTIDTASLTAMIASWCSTSWREETTILDLYVRHTDPVVARDVLEVLLEEYGRLSKLMHEGSETYAFDYMLEKSGEMKAKMLDGQAMLNRYKECLSLSERLNGAKAQLFELEKRYLPAWPALVEARELQRLLRQHFAGELEKVVVSFPEEAEFWEQNLNPGAVPDEDALIDAKLRLVHSRVDVLRKESEADGAIYENLTTKLKEGDVSRGYRAKPFYVIQPPTPASVFASKRNATISSFAMGGFAIGAAFVMLFGFMDSSLWTVTDLERFSRVPVVGALPNLAGENGKKSHKHSNRRLVMVDDPQSHAAEAMRTLRAGLALLDVRVGRKSFAICSALQSEGKSWIAGNLAVAFAMQGDRTLIIDGDLRRPVQHRIFECCDREKPGFTQFLAGEAELHDVIQPASVDGLYPAVDDLFLVTAGERASNPAELLGGRRLSEFFTEVLPRFDRVIIDSAPLLPVSDSLVLAKLVDSVVMTYRIGNTPRRALQQALKVLEANQTPAAGIIANQLPTPRRRSAYGYYYSYYGGSGYSQYGGYGASQVNGKNGSNGSKGSPRSVKSGERRAPAPILPSGDGPRSPSSPAVPDEAADATDAADGRA